MGAYLPVTLRKSVVNLFDNFEYFEYIKKDSE